MTPRGPNWNGTWGSGMEAEELRRLKSLEEENRRLKSVVADLSLDKQILQDVVSKISETCSSSSA